MIFDLQGVIQSRRYWCNFLVLILSLWCDSNLVVHLPNTRVKGHFSCLARRIHCVDVCQRANSTLYGSQSPQLKAVTCGHVWHFLDILSQAIHQVCIEILSIPEPLPRILSSLERKNAAGSKYCSSFTI